MIVTIPGHLLYFCFSTKSSLFPVSILYKSIAGHYRPVRVADGPITARYRFIKNAGRVVVTSSVCFLFSKDNILQKIF